MFCRWKIAPLAFIKIMLNASIVNPVTDTEHFASFFIYFYPSLGKFVQVTGEMERREAIQWETGDCLKAG